MTRPPDEADKDQDVSLARDELWAVQKDGDLCESDYISSDVDRTDDEEGKAGNEEGDVTIPYRRIRRLLASHHAGECASIRERASEV
jgi:hypothetical protein